MVSSWQRASRRLAEKIQLMFPFHSRTVGKYPRGKVLDICIRANLCQVARTLDAAFDVIDVLERGPEELLLIGTMRTPEGTVHFRALRIETLRKAVQPTGLLMVDKGVQATADGQD